MPTYEVIVRRTEAVTFHVVADDADAAREACLSEGDEVGSSCLDPEVVLVQTIGQDIVERSVRELPEVEP